MLFGWVTAGSSDEQTHEVLASMSGALHVSTSEREAIWVTANFGIGILALDDAAAPRTTHEPARDGDGTALWMSGEAFDWPSHGGLRTVAESRCLSFRMRLLTALRAEGAGAIREISTANISLRSGIQPRRRFSCSTIDSEPCRCTSERVRKDSPLPEAFAAY